MHSIPYRVAALAAVILMLGALSGCASTRSTAAKASAEEESGPEAVAEPEAPEQVEVAEALEQAPSEVTAAPEAAMCYLGLEFTSETLRATTVRVDVDGNMVALLGAGDKTVVQYAEGMHGVSVAHPKASKKKRKKNSIAVELKPFTYTKIVIEESAGKKSKKRLIVRVLEDGEEIRARTIEL